MKKYLIALVTLSFSFSYAIQKNPQIRTCNTLGGEFLVANTANDQIGFCQFGKAIIGAQDLTFFNNKEKISQSIDNYMKNQINCEPMGQIQTLIVVGTYESLQFCSYNDGSFIELGTLIKGKNSADNSKLNQALGL